MIGGWIHFIKSKSHAYELDDAILKVDGIYVESRGLIKGALITKDGRIFGEEGLGSPVIMTNCLNDNAIKILKSMGVSPEGSTVSLSELLEEQIEEKGEKGLIIKNIDYLDYLDFLSCLESIFN